MGQLQFKWHHLVSNVGMSLNMIKGSSKKIKLFFVHSKSWKNCATCRWLPKNNLSFVQMVHKEVLFAWK
jgi:hypothetical protein